MKSKFTNLNQLVINKKQRTSNFNYLINNSNSPNRMEVENIL